MSAFLGYEGEYEHQGDVFDWRCYATTRIHELRRGEHAPLPEAPAGQHWICAHQRRFDKPVAFLVDDGVRDFSQMLVQVGRRPKRTAHGDLARRGAA